MTDEEKIKAYDKAHTPLALIMKKVVLRGHEQEVADETGAGPSTIKRYAFGIVKPHPLILDFMINTAQEVLDRHPLTATWRHV